MQDQYGDHWMTVGHLCTLLADVETTFYVRACDTHLLIARHAWAEDENYCEEGRVRFDTETIEYF